MRRLVALLLLWDALLLVEIALHLGLERGLYRHPFLSWVDASRCLSLAALWQLLIVLAGGLLAAAAGRALPGRTRPVAGALLLWPLLVGWALAWYLFSNTGRFPGIDALRFVAANPVQTFQHATHIFGAEAVWGPLLLLAFALLGVPALLAAARHVRPGWVALSQLQLLAAAALFIAAGGGAGDPSLEDQFLDPDSQVYRSRSAARAEALEVRASPTASLIYDLRYRLDPPRTRVPADAPVRVEHHPQLPLRDYLRAAPADPPRTNAILILVESLRPDELESFGGRRSAMPRVDALARRSMRFPDSYTQSSHSSYADPCPISSHYPLRSRDIHLYPESPPYPRVLIWDILQPLGYRSAIFSSQNEGWGQMANYLRSDGLDELFDAASYDGETYLPTEDVGFRQFAQREKLSGKIDDRVTVDAAIRWIDAGTKPFYLYLNLQNSHLPYTVPDDFQRPFGADVLDFQIRFGDFPRDRIGAVRDRYSDALAYVDAQIGRLLDHLDRRGLLDRTIVIVTGDTGQAFYEHGFAAHASWLYDEVVRVPLFFYVPGRAGEDRAAPAEHVDVPPTLLALLGLPPHPAHQGRDLLRADPLAPHSRFLVVQSPLAHQYAIVRDGHKFLMAPRGGELLFDLRTDPGETANLALREPDRARDLRLRLQTWVAAQLEYYESFALYSRRYPPVLRERAGSAE